MTDTSSSPSTANLDQCFRDLAQQGFIPLLVRQAAEPHLVPLDSRLFLHWVSNGATPPAGTLVAFPCQNNGESDSFSPLELRRLQLLTQRYLDHEYVQATSLVSHQGHRLYVDWPNAHGLQFSCGITGIHSTSLVSSMRLVFPAVTAYPVDDYDVQGHPRRQWVRPFEVPMHTLLGSDHSDRAARLAARFGVQVIGEISQLASEATERRVITTVCQLLAAFARAVTTTAHRPTIFADGCGVALAIAAVPRLADVLIKCLAQRVAPVVSDVARVALHPVGSASWRLGTLEVPLLLTIHPSFDHPIR